MSDKFGFYTDTYSDGTSIETLGVGDGKAQFTSVVFPDGSAALGMSYGGGAGENTAEEFPAGTTPSDVGIQFQIKFNTHASVNAAISTLYEVKSRLAAREDKRSHVDNFIAYGKDEQSEPYESYARWILHYYRLPFDILSMQKDYMAEHKLFCMHNGVKHRVVGAGDIGDILITEHLEEELGPRKRVYLDELSGWSNE